MTDKELMQQALEALECHADIGIKADKAITALRERLEQPEQEPVAWLCTDYDGHFGLGATKEEAKTNAGELCGEFIPLYTISPRQEQQEPIAWMVYTLDGKSVCVTDNPADFTTSYRALPLYTTPQPRQWQGLSKEDRYMSIRPLYRDDASAALAAAHSNDEYEAIEAKLREKNGGNT